MIGLFAAVLFFGGANVARAATDPLSGLPCAELSGDTQPTIDANGYMNSGAMYFGQYKVGRPTTSPWWAGFNITKPVYYAPAGSAACVTEKDGKAYLQGWVWNDNIGWISLYCPPTSLNRGIPCGPVTYGVQIAPIPGSNPAEWVFSGYAWGNAGWIRMNCDATSGYGDSSYCATSKHAVTLDYGLKMVKVAAYDWLNPTALTPTTGKAWAWTSGLQWLSFGGMKVPLGACANPALCDNDDATFVNYEGDVLVTKKMVPNQEATVSVTMSNSGTLAWAPGAQPDKSHYMLSPVPGADVWKVDSSPNPAVPGQLQMVTNSVVPGKSRTFTFKIKAPAVKGTYNFQWQMKKDVAPGFFGQKSDLIQIVVDDAAVKKVGPFGNPGEFLTVVREPIYINSTSDDSTATSANAAVNPVTPAQVRNLVYRNVQKWKKVASTSCGQNGSLLLQNENSKDTVYYCKGDVRILPGKWTGNKTIIVDGGNVHILGSLYSTKGQLGIIALRSKLNDPSQGNVYVYPDVRDLRVQMYADGSVYPVVADLATDTAVLQSNGSPSISNANYGVAPGNTLFGQLYFQGMIISNNNPNTEGATGDEQLKSLGSLRSVPTDPESGAPLSWNDYFMYVSEVKNGTLDITDPDTGEVSTSVKYTGYPVSEEKAKRKSANYTPTEKQAKFSVFINYEPPAQNLPGFDGIVGGGVKQTGGQ